VLLDFREYVLYGMGWMNEDEDEELWHGPDRSEEYQGDDVDVEMSFGRRRGLAPLVGRSSECTTTRTTTTTTTTTTTPRATSHPTRKKKSRALSLRNEKQEEKKEEEKGRG